MVPDFTLYRVFIYLHGPCSICLQSGRPWNCSISSGLGLKWNLLESRSSNSEQHLRDQSEYSLRTNFFFHKGGGEGRRGILLNEYSLYIKSIKNIKTPSRFIKEIKCGKLPLILVELYAINKKNPSGPLLLLGTLATFSSKHFNHWNFHIFIKLKLEKISTSQRISAQHMCSRI